MHGDRRDGGALLDVVVALTLLGMSGVGLVAVVGQTARSMRSVTLAERETRLAARELDRFVVYGRAELIAMTGHREVGGWIVSVEQVAPDLFDVAIASTNTSPALLRTTLYRPDTSDAVRP